MTPTINTLSVRGTTPNSPSSVVVSASLPAVWQPTTQQQLYRAIQHGMSFPGTIQDLRGLLGESPAALGIVATLCDHQVSLCDDDAMLADAGVHLARALPGDFASADFIVCRAAAPAPPATTDNTDNTPKLGTIYQPHTGATLILIGERVGLGDLSLTLRGPGIPESQVLSLQGFHESWFERRNTWVANYPLGVDVLLCDRHNIAALPRTTTAQW